MFPSIKNYCDSLAKEFDKIPNERKIILEKISTYIRAKIQTNSNINLVYICTHNSRRSHFGQIWAHVAGKYYNVKNVSSFSGGTEATAFNINAINSLKRIGFIVESNNTSVSPLYRIQFDKSNERIECFSKVYDDKKNPKKDFVAIMTCSDAEENCPLIPGAELRIATTYNDPKEFDNTALQDAKYDERCQQIALETFYVFSKI